MRNLRRRGDAEQREGASGRSVRRKEGKDVDETVEQEVEPMGVVGEKLTPPSDSSKLVTSCTT